MNILLNYDLEFNNTYELIYDSSIEADAIKKFDSKEFDLVVNFNASSNIVSSIILVDKVDFIKDKRVWTIAHKNIVDTVEKSIRAKDENHLIFNKNANICVGRIVARNKHPKSEKLYVLDVDFKSFKCQIVTNTLYTTPDKILAFYLPGSITPDAQVIKLGEVMNVKSEGMLCSAASLKLDKYTDLFENDVLKNLPITLKNEYIGKNIDAIFPELITQI
ncbi:hypothetical protein E1I18_01975 [Mycoplasmopsis mucosicanis]|uniref:tRNA-binding domain-containing protein n=1 Tax=Mycoplasmopsis mucosicanis TaxID=458208 RepID=A0A507SIJ6_9BACT|nr:hypothetical protein [Mycoplasmopsis mucosicanis]TQC51540.1 hypothetical protein E1I18_01975 [Mycoplasmopsis mucosicanis]